MAQPLVSDKMWRRIEPLVEKPARGRKGGRPPVSDRAALTGILFVLKSGIPWDQLPHEIGAGSGMTCLRRLRRWQQTGAWDKMRRVLLSQMAEPDCIDWARAERRSSGESSLSSDVVARSEYRHFESGTEG
jgi:transposase